jgi:hypothetical protein
MVFGDQINRQTLLKTNTMNKVIILKKFFTSVTPKRHKVRRASLTSCVSSLLNGAKASVTIMGLGISSSAYEKHRIKQVDRLLSNKRIFAEKKLSTEQSIHNIRMLHHVLLFWLTGRI